MLVEYGSVRVRSPRVRHVIFGDLPGSGVQFPNISFENSGEPDVPFSIGNQAVRPGFRRFQGKLGELFAFGIKASQLVGHLPGVPERAIRSNSRIMWARVRRRYLPF